MRSRNRSIAALAAVIVAAGAGVAVSGGSAYAAQSTETVYCGDGQKLDVRIPINKSSSGGWGAAHIVSGGTGHLNPIRFTGSLHDDTADVTLFSFDQVKASGNANHNQPTITCTQSESGTLEDFLEPGEIPPPGTSATDTVTFNLEVTAVPHS